MTDSTLLRSLAWKALQACMAVFLGIAPEEDKILLGLK